MTHDAGEHEGCGIDSQREVAKCVYCQDSHIEFVATGHGNIEEQPCGYCRPTPTPGYFHSPVME